MARDSLWLFGIDYLEHSSVEGSQRHRIDHFLKFNNNLISGVGAIELLLPKIPISSERQAMKIIVVAKRKGLIEVGESLSIKESSKMQTRVIVTLVCGP